MEFSVYSTVGVKLFVVLLIIYVTHIDVRLGCVFIVIIIIYLHIYTITGLPSSAKNACNRKEGMNILYLENGENGENGKNIKKTNENVYSSSFVSGVDTIRDTSPPSATTLPKITLPSSVVPILPHRFGFDKPPSFDEYKLPKADISVVTPYTALMVEPRKHKALEFVLTNFLENLNEKWTIIVLHGKLNEKFLNNTINGKLQKYKYRIITVNIGVDNLTVAQYSELFYNRLFYDYIPTEMFLIFQTDSIIIKENRDKIYEFMDYDYVGAPWNSGVYGPTGVGNGGLSLRRKSKMLELLMYKNENIKYNSEYSNFNKNEYGKYIAEDRFFCGDLIHQVVTNKPTVNKAKQFSVEVFYCETPFGIHKCWHHLNRSNFNDLANKYKDIRILYELNR